MVLAYPTIAGLPTAKKNYVDINPSEANVRRSSASPFDAGRIMPGGKDIAGPFERLG